METKRETKRETAREPNYVVVDFLDLDPAKFSFGTTKKNTFDGIVVPVKYDGKMLFVRYPKRTAPFGVSANTQKADPKKGTAERVTGYNLALSCSKDYESDPLYQKTLELDEMFITECARNSCAWGLGGTVAKPLPRDRVAGLNEYGDGGSWKRLLKWSYKKDQTTNEKIYSTEYPPRVEVSVPATIVGDDIATQTSKFTANFFDEAGEKIDNVTHETIESVVPKFSEVSCLVNWSHLTQGTYGITMKPMVKQMRVYPRDGLPDDECLLDDNVGGAPTASADLENALDEQPQRNSSVRAVGSRVPPQPTKVPVQVNYEDEDSQGEGEVVEDESEVVEAPAPAPAPSRVATRVVARTVTRK